MINVNKCIVAMALLCAFAFVLMIGLEIHRELIDNNDRIQFSLEGYCEGMYFINVVNRTGEMTSQRISYLR